MKILTFGSCLSRYTANNYIKLFGGELLASVYHNRSDYFVNKFILRKWQQYTLEELSEYMESSPSINPDENSALILRNQFEDGIGKHRLSSSEGLYPGLGRNPDLILMDNYLDLSGKLVYKKGSDEGVFLRLGDFTDAQEVWNMGALLSPEAGAKNMSRIISHFKEKSPSTKIVFINFPFNTYNCIDRENRHIKYQDFMCGKGDFTIPCLDVHESFQTKDRQHFKPGQYCALAGMINAFLQKSCSPWPIRLLKGIKI